MTEEQSQTIVIVLLKDQLRLASFHIRNYIQDNINSFYTKAFMLRFADECERIHKTTSKRRVMKRYELLLDLEMYCAPYLNYLANSGEHDQHFQNKMRETIAELWALEHPNFPRDQIAWLPTEIKPADPDQETHNELHPKPTTPLETE